jgi:hypothetical protein
MYVCYLAVCEWTPRLVVNDIGHEPGEGRLFHQVTQGFQTKICE